MEQQFKVNFNFNLLSKSASEENATIRVIVRFGEQRKEVKLSTGIKVAKTIWDNKSQRLIISDDKYSIRVNRENRKTNKILDAISERIVTMFKQSTVRDNIYSSVEAMKKELTAILNEVFGKEQKEEERKTQGATDWMLKYIDSDRIDTHTMRYVSERTKNHQRTVVHRLIQFLTDCKLPNSFDTFTSVKFEQQYTNWAYKMKNYKQNTVIATFGVLKPLLNAAKKDGIEIDDTNYKELQGKGKDVDNIYLTEDEITNIYNLDIKALKESRDIDRKSTIEETRDLFVIAAWTGLRRSDIAHLSDAVWSVDGDNDLLTITAEKTKRQIVIPLHPYVKELYKKYDGRFPKLGDKANVNRQLRALGQLAKVDTIVPIVENRGGKVTTYNYRKFELIGFHSARRSFATNMYKRGVPSIAIMQITGHTTETNFLKYIKITKEENALMVAKLMKNFFK